jgi:hypothetical protein
LQGLPTTCAAAIVVAFGSIPPVEKRRNLLANLSFNVNCSVAEIIDHFRLVEKEIVPGGAIVSGVGAKGSKPELCTTLKAGVVNTTPSTTCASGKESVIPVVWEPCLYAD